jgi:hypothetical protein
MCSYKTSMSTRDEKRKASQKASQKAWRLKNRDKLKERQRALRATPEGMAALARYNASGAWRAAEARWRSKNVDRVRVRSAARGGGQAYAERIIRDLERELGDLGGFRE